MKSLNGRITPPHPQNEGTGVKQSGRRISSLFDINDEATGAFSTHTLHGNMIGLPKLEEEQI